MYHKKTMHIKKSILLITLITSIGLSYCTVNKSETKQQKPNVLVIYLDDLGYGDVSAYGSVVLQTPNIDRLANGGIRFTDAHSSSSTCTPSRYALLTGIYPWRNKNAKILPGDAALIIDTNQITIPRVLKQSGYYTGVIGKWHLGLGEASINWNKRISPGPNEVGFDYAHIMAATQDRVPTVYLKNGNVVNLSKNDPIKVDYKNNFEGESTGLNNPELTNMKWHHGHNGSIVNGIPRIGFMKGGESAKWSDVDMADYFLNDLKSFIKAKKNNPFFLYYAMQQPHVPRTPSSKFVGKSGLGPRGDVILEADWCIGEVMRTLKEEGLLANTLVILSSDNGPVLNDGYYDDAVEKLGNHKPAGNLRGGKYSLFEAGTRVPFITYWEGKIKPQVSNALVCQVDLLSSLAKLVGANFKTSDSQNILPALLGKTKQARTDLILEANFKTCLRHNNWVLIPPYSGKGVSEQTNIELGTSENYQLYNLTKDIAQKQNIANTEPQKLKELTAIYKHLTQ